MTTETGAAYVLSQWGNSERDSLADFASISNMIIPYAYASPEATATLTSLPPAAETFPIVPREHVALCAIRSSSYPLCSLTVLSVLHLKDATETSLTLPSPQLSRGAS